MVPDELAPVVFDTHYAFDPDARQLLYTHSSLRNATLLPKALGAGGLCRVSHPTKHAFPSSLLPSAY